MSDELAKIAIFQKREIRKQLHNGEWWFVIADVIAALIDSADPAQYLKRLRLRDKELAELFDQPVEKGAVQIVPPLALPFDTPGGKQKLLGAVAGTARKQLEQETGRQVVSADNYLRKDSKRKAVADDSNA